MASFTQVEKPGKNRKHPNKADGKNRSENKMTPSKRKVDFYFSREIFFCWKLHIAWLFSFSWLIPANRNVRPREQLHSRGREL
ncbi:hypothetical protein M8J76_003425 [Diaphorina citri]|nr:hypothetical protein M8J76_003425 [Diaphorina citri]